MKRTAWAIALLSASAFAQAQGEPDAEAARGVRTLLGAMFDKPGAPVDVGPIVVRGRHAVAGWTQESLGGRALLRHEAKGWVLIACAGDGMKEAATLQLAGIAPADAAALARQITVAEAGIPARRREQFSRFGAMVSAEAAHGAAHAPDRSHR